MQPLTSRRAHGLAAVRVAALAAACGGRLEASSGAGSDAAAAPSQTQEAGDTSPPDAGACSGGHCVTTLASFENFVPVAIAVDTAYVYCLIFPPSPYVGELSGSPILEPGSILRIPRDAGAPVAIVESASNMGYWAIASDGSNVYWTIPSDGGVSPDLVPASPLPTGAVMRTPVNGGATAAIASQQTYPTYVVADATGVYWVTGLFADDGVTNNSVLALPADASAPITIASNQSGLNGIATDGEEMAWCANDNGTVVAAQEPAGGPAVLAEYFRCGPAVAVNADGVYWTDGNDETATAGPSVMSPLEIGPPGLLAAYAHALYIAPNDGAQILRIDTEPGADAAPAAIVADAGATALAADAIGVYWTTWDSANGVAAVWMTTN